MRTILAISIVAFALAGGCGRIGYSPLAPSGGGGAIGPGTAGTGGGAGVGGVGMTGAAGSPAGTGGTGTGGVAPGTGGMGGAAGSPVGTGGAAGTGGAGTGGAAGGAGGSTLADAGAGCSTASFGGHLYAFCSTTLSWSDAQSDCLSRGMRLARMDDASENSWVTSTAFAGVTSVAIAYWPWIGATDQAVLGQWTWTDGALFWVGPQNGSPQGGLYNNWVAGSPSATGQSGRCGILQHGGFWTNVDCTLLQSYVCEQY